MIIIDMKLIFGALSGRDKRGAVPIAPFGARRFGLLEMDRLGQG